MAKSIAIISLGSGVGKTTNAINIALALHKLNHKVLVFDADFTKDNLKEHLGIHNIPVHLGHVFNGDAHILDAVYRHPTGLKIIPSNTHDYDKLSYHYQDLTADHDYIIIDTPSHPAHLKRVLENATDALIVHDPKYSSKNVLDAINLLEDLRIVNLGIVLNNFSENSTGVLHGYHVIERIPPSEDIRKSFELKNPLLHTHPRSEASNKFFIIARKLE
ncbi:MAG TPA: AAA family ATPase [Alphaproteobacteria bacterium]|nr:AAA family ATPase [Alphaproteobacteria bacterium]